MKFQIDKDIENSEETPTVLVSGNIIMVGEADAVNPE